LREKKISFAKRAQDDLSIQNFEQVPENSNRNWCIGNYRHISFVALLRIFAKLFGWVSRADRGTRIA